MELATISFGQRFEVTPIQMIKMLGTIANGGISVSPRLVKGIVDSKTGEEKELIPQEGEQVISKSSAHKVLSMMQSVVDEGTGKNARVEGYNIGGKTGTSEDGVNTGKRIASFVGVADVSNPELVMIVILYNPTGEGGHQGGGVAAPVAGQILNEVLPYLEITKKDEEIKEKVKMPNITGLTFKDAKQILKENELETSSQMDLETIITNQVPKEGILIDKGTKVLLYGN